MNLKRRVYSVLIVSAADSFVSAVRSMLPESLYYPVKSVPGISAAKRAFSEQGFDFVIIDSPLPDDFGIRFAVDCCESGGTVVLVFVKSQLHDEVYDKVAEHGVFTLPKPTSRQSIAQALSWMASTRERLRKFEKITLSVKDKMEEIRLVNRAKWLLISELKMDEPAAHRYIEKQSMDKCVSRRKIAEGIIKTYF